MKRTYLLLAGALCALTATGAYAGQSQTPAPAPVATVASAGPLTLPADFDGAAPPDLPATVSRDSQGRTTVRIVKLTAPLRVDGSLDEALYREVQPISDFIQVEPQAGAPATERTEVWLSFDGDNIYVSARMTESQPNRMIVNEMRRDSFNLIQNENFQFALDTFNDHRNSVSFQFNPAAGRMDGQITNESTFNSDFNPIWRLQVRRTPDGWTAEAAVPFKSLRYRAGAPAQIWGVQLRRIDRWKNEISYLTKLPANASNNGHQRVSQYATMVGLEVPTGGTRTLDLKPYLTSNVTTDATLTQDRNKFGKDVGFDAKYGVTQNLGADFTYRTDFAQVEADEQQVNLTRFSLFFPEKREFFLENQGLFQFASGNTGNGGNNNQNSETPTLFYSRRIGLDGGHQVPLEAGGRLSGRIGRYSVGVMNIETDDVEAFGVPAVNFAVARVKRDILRRSSIGALYTRRSRSAAQPGQADTFGLDGAFAFYQNVYANIYWAQTSTPGTGDDDTSYRGQFFYNSDRWGIQAEKLAVGEDFDPQVGFMRREDFHKDRAQFRFSPRPRNHFKSVRKFSYQGSVEHFTNPAGKFESREREVEWQTQFQSSEQLTVVYNENRERLVRPFGIARGVTVPVGDYHYGTLQLSFQVGQQRTASGTWGFQAGSFYGGTRRTYSYSGARVKINQQFSLEPSVSVNQVSLPFGDFTTNLLSTRATYTVTPLMFVSGLVQYNSNNSSISTNVRLRWEYQPGSELFVVYNDGRDTTGSRVATLQNRALIFKVNRLFRF